MGFDYEPEEIPIVFWDLLAGEPSDPRHGVRDGAALGFAHAKSQRRAEGVIDIAFRFADDDPEIKATDGEGLVDLKACGSC